MCCCPLIRCFDGATPLGGATLVNGVAIEDWSPLWSTAGFGVVIFALALVAFQRRNY